MSRFRALDLMLVLLGASLALAACTHPLGSQPAMQIPNSGADAIAAPVITIVPTGAPVSSPAAAPSLVPTVPPTSTPFAGPVTITMGPGRDEAQPGMVTLDRQGNQTRVTLLMQGGQPGVPQPAHIHQGSCPDRGPVEFPLANVVDGKSITVVNAALSDLFNGQYSIHVHKSAAESTRSTACAPLPQLSP